MFRRTELSDFRIMLSSSLPSASAVSLFVAYFLGNCGSQIWSHAHFFMFGLLTLLQFLLWNCALENWMAWMAKLGDAHTILLLHLLYSLWEFFQIHGLINIWRMKSDTSGTSINLPTHERGKESTRCWSPFTKTLGRTDGGIWAQLWLSCEGKAGDEKVAS